MKTTLNKIREHSPCAGGWRKLLDHLGKTQADDDPLSLLTILESNGLEDALWCVRAVDGYDREIRLLAVKYARRVQHLMRDPRSIAALDVAERYANGEATDEELSTAKATACAASIDACAAMNAASISAAEAADAASGAALDVGCVTAYAASAAACGAFDAAMDAFQAVQEAEFRAMLARCEEKSQ